MPFALRYGQNAGEAIAAMIEDNPRRVVSLSGMAVGGVLGLGRGQLPGSNEGVSSPNCHGENKQSQEELCYA